MLQLTGAFRRAASKGSIVKTQGYRLASSTVQRPGGEQEPEAVAAAIPTSQYGEIGLVSGAPGEVYTRKVDPAGFCRRLLCAQSSSCAIAWTF